MHEQIQVVEYFDMFSPLCLLPLSLDARMFNFPTEKYSHMINSLWKTRSLLKTCIYSSQSIYKD